MLATIKALHKNILGILAPRDISHRQFALSNNISDEMLTHVEVLSVGMKTGFLMAFRALSESELIMRIEGVVT